MIPYELRFQIFKHATNLAQDEYHAKYTMVAMWNANPSNSVKMEHPDFPTYEQIENLAHKINNFVS